jgi:hypothetical protein
MSPAQTTAISSSSKDPAKMSKGELLRLYRSAAVENENLTKKYGQYPRVSRGESDLLNVGYMIWVVLRHPRKGSKEV